MADTDFLALCAELVQSVELLLELRPPEARPLRKTEDRLTRARAALAQADEPALPEGREPVSVAMQLTEPGAEGPGAEALANFTAWFCRNYPGPDTLIHRPEWHAPKVFRAAAAAIARWGNPAPVPPADGEVAELVRMLTGIAYWRRQGRPGEGDPSSFDKRQADRLDRAAELLQRQAVAEESSVTATVPVAVSDALTKAECALADIAEGEPMTDEGDPLRWAERRCADTLAIIRPTMRQHKIRTSEWPPVPAHALPLPEAE